MTPLSLRRNSIKLPKLAKKPPTLTSSLDVSPSAYSKFNLVPAPANVQTVVHGKHVKKFV